MHLGKPKFARIQIDNYIENGLQLFWARTDLVDEIHSVCVIIDYQVLSV